MAPPDKSASGDIDPSYQKVERIFHHCVQRDKGHESQPSNAAEAIP